MMLITSISIFLSDGEEETEDGGGIWFLQLSSNCLRHVAACIMTHTPF